MSAQIETEVSWRVWCADCPWGFGPTDDDILAELAMQGHNSEHHGATS